MQTAPNAAPVTITGTCDKCSGAGSLWWLRHYADGVCFQCAGTGKCEAEITAAGVQNEILAADAEDKAAWIAKQADADPVALAARLARLSFARVYDLRNWTAGSEDLAHRVCYWAASTAINAWPSGRAYPLEWIYA